MAEFSAAAELSVTLASGEAGSVRQQLERELSDIEVGVSSAAPSGGGAVGGRGPESAGIDLARRQLGEQETIVDLLQEQNELLEDGVGGGGGGGSRVPAGIAGGLAARGAPSLAAGGLAAGGATAAAAIALPIIGGKIGQTIADEIDRAFPEARGETGIAGTQFSEEGLAGDTTSVFETVFNIDLSSEVTVGPAAGGEGRRQFAEADFADSREVESLLQSELNRFEQRLKRELGGGTTPRSAPGTGGNARMK